MSSDDFRIVAVEWELRLPDPLPMDWDSHKPEFFASLKPTYQLPQIRGTRADFDLALVNEVVNQRSARSHLCCDIDGPDYVVTILSIDEDWWVVQLYGDQCRLYGEFEAPPESSAIQGFQERGHGMVFPISESTAIDSDTAIGFAARVAAGDENAPFVEVPMGIARWALDAVDLDFLG